MKSNIDDIELSPAYGLKCPTDGDLMDAWVAGKDFFCPKLRYVSIRDIATLRKMNKHILLTSNFFDYIVI